MFEDSRLKIFLTVSRTGNFTKAARELGISQPAVSQSIAQLEKDLGGQLFSRERGEVVPTATAMAFKPYAEKILHWYSTALDMFGPEGAALSGKPVRVGADGFVASCLLPPVLGGLMASDRKLRLITVPYGEEADISVVLVRRDGTLDFAGSLVGVVQAVAVASSGRLMAVTSLADLPDGVSLAVWNTYGDMLPLDAVPRVSVRSASVGLIMALVASDPALVGILPQPSCRQGGLTRLSIPLPQLQMDIHLQAPDNAVGLRFSQLLSDSLR